MENRKFEMDGLTIEAIVEETRYNETFEGGQVQRNIVVTVYDAAGNAVSDPEAVRAAEDLAIIYMTRQQQAPRGSKELFFEERSQLRDEEMRDFYGQGYLTFIK